MDKCFKLLVELGTRPKDELVSIVNHIWAKSCLAGPYIDMSGLQPKGVPELYPYDEDSYGPNLFSVQSHWGYATLPNGSRVPCICDIRYYGRKLGHCLDLSFRWEALDAAFQTDSSYLSEDRLNPHWYAEIEGWFRVIGEALYESFGFRLGIIGIETDLLSISNLRRHGIPEDRRQAMLVEAGQRVYWYPPAQARPPGAVRTGSTLR